MYTAILVWLFFAVWMAFSWYKDEDAKDMPIWARIFITVWGAAVVGVHSSFNEITNNYK